jgi:prepilin-type N-terminal cleavage/methylation domain-containing protein
MSGRFRRHAAVTLIELLVVITLLGLVLAAVGSAFTAGLDIERRQKQRRQEQRRIEDTERRIERLFEGAILSDDTTDRATFFIGETTDGDGSLGCDRVTFTTLAPGVPLAAQESADDFLTQQESHGPVGGTTEVSLATTPLGDAGDRRGLFLRQQHPADGDTTQGGQESVLDTAIARIGFAFYTGEEWTTDWDTTTGTRRLPAAVRVRYTLTDDPETVHEMVIGLPASDVDSQNPVAAGVGL